MARRRKTAAKEDAGRAKVRTRSPRVRKRRERKEGSDNRPDDLSWLLRSSLQMNAMKIINAVPRVWHLSIPWGPGDGVEPVAGFLPCSYFRTKDRIYYSFSFREHRDELFDRWRYERKARKETSCSVSRRS